MSQNEDRTYLSVKPNKIELFENGQNTAKIERNWIKYPWSINNFFFYGLEEKFTIGNEEFFYDDYEYSVTTFWYYFFGEIRKHSVVDKKNNILCRTETLKPRQYMFWGSFTTASRIYFPDGRFYDISGSKESIIQFQIPFISFPTKNKTYKISISEEFNTDSSLSKKEIAELILFGFYDQWAYRRKVGSIVTLVLIASAIVVYFLHNIDLSKVSLGITN